MQSEQSSTIFENYFAIAFKFCEYYEMESVEDQRQFLSRIQGLLLELYSLGRNLPEIDASEEEFDCLLERDDKHIQGMIAHKVPFSCYWRALEPFAIDEPELGLEDLLDDLGDIYMDLKRAILLYDSKLEGASQEAHWKLKFDFDYHLADHCMNALKAIHDYMGKDGYSGW